MRIQSFYLHNVRGLPNIKLDFLDRATGQVRPRTVIAGSNGTGKTTALEAICALLKLARGTKPVWLRPNEAQAGIVVTDLPFSLKYPLAIEVGNREQLAGIAYLSGRRAISSGPEPMGPTITNIGQPAEWMPAAIEEAEAGKSDFPNCLYFPSEGRELQPKQVGQVIGEPKSYQWVYRFSDSQRWQGSLESFLVALDYRDLMAQREGRTGNGEFRQFVRVINQFLQGKQIVGVDQQSFRVQVEADNGQQFTVDALSSGEKQILLMLGEIQRRLRRGGILLIDEPEIHLHPRWQRLLIRALTDLCAEQNAQLIITTHSEEVANAVYEHELILLDAIFAQESLP
jgi:predicted ATPase